MARRDVDIYDNMKVNQTTSFIDSSNSFDRVQSITVLRTSDIKFCAFLRERNNGRGLQVSQIIEEYEVGDMHKPYTFVLWCQGRLRRTPSGEATTIVPLKK